MTLYEVESLMAAFMVGMAIGLLLGLYVIPSLVDLWAVGQRHRRGR
jgi:hypothetical protein